MKQTNYFVMTLKSNYFIKKPQNIHVSQKIGATQKVLTAFKIYV